MIDVRTSLRISGRPFRRTKRKIFHLSEAFLHFSLASRKALSESRLAGSYTPPRRPAMPRAFVISAPALLSRLECAFKLNIGFLPIGSANVISRRLLERGFHDFVGDGRTLI